MGFEIKKATSGGEIVTKTLAGEDLYRDDDGKLVGAGQSARVLVARKGRPVPIAYVDAVTETGKIKQAKKAPIKKVPTTKARKPSANKSRKGSSDK